MEEKDIKNVQDWIEHLAPLDGWNQRHALAAFALMGVPSTLLDVGSGTGALVNTARKLDCMAYGVDQVERDEDYLFTHDLTKPFSLAEHGPSLVDVVFSIEVAEHIEREFHPIFCDTVANHVTRGGYLIFTSAFPGQEGEGHVGVSPAPYWRTMFYDRGLAYRRDLSVWLALLWNNIESPMFWLPANVQVFER